VEPFKVTFSSVPFGVLTESVKLLFGFLFPVRSRCFFLYIYIYIILYIYIYIILKEIDVCTKMAYAIYAMPIQPSAAHSYKHLILS
jgi:uncharacterized membrane protein